jgi:prolyl-tRNA editing enzyme YbaK/EbsC (Cys-tRNA(Pro) deacylase)
MLGGAGPRVKKGNDMSKSLARVRAALNSAGADCTPVQMPTQTRTAQQAADAAGCALNQIVKSIIFAGASGQLYLFLTAGGNQVQPTAAATLADEDLGRADADAVRAVTGFAIGGVAPLGHLTPLPLWMDETLLQFETVWAAAGTPNHIFSIAPQRLVQITGAKVARFV